MKKLAYISALALALGVVSCQKEDIQPVGTSGEAVPTWNDATKSRSNESATDPESGDEDSGAVTDPNKPTTGITDPNQDEDSNGRKRN